MSLPTRTLAHTAGSRFSLTLSQPASFFNDGAVDVPDLTGYAAKLQLLHGDEVAVELVGTWVSAVTPFALRFEALSTKTWVRRNYSLQLLLQEPNAPVGADPYLKRLSLVLEVC